MRNGVPTSTFAAICPRMANGIGMAGNQSGEDLVLPRPAQ
jgi:hypothetical protein